jgi:hypothetical protein
MSSIITDPATEDTHYGIPVCHIGEDGNMLALGHPGPNSQPVTVLRARKTAVTA